MTGVGFEKGLASAHALLCAPPQCTDTRRTYTYTWFMANPHTHTHTRKYAYTHTTRTPTARKDIRKGKFCHPTTQRCLCTQCLCGIACYVRLYERALVAEKFSRARARAHFSSAPDCGSFSRWPKVKRTARAESPSRRVVVAVSRPSFRFVNIVFVAAHFSHPIIIHIRTRSRVHRHITHLIYTYLLYTYMYIFK